MYFDYMVEMMEELPHAAFMNFDKALTHKGSINPTSYNRSILRQVVPELLGFFDRDPDDAALKRPTTVNYVTRFAEGYEKYKIPARIARYS